MRQRFTWNKEEKLKSRKRIECVFKEGKSFSVFPFRVFYLVEACGGPGSRPAVAGQPEAAASGPAAIRASGPGVDQPGGPAGADGDQPGEPEAMGQPGVERRGTAGTAVVQAGFGAGSRHFKKAVDRNRIKRLSREAYRLQKQPLIDRMRAKGLSMSVFFVYTGKELPDYRTVKEKIGVVLQKLIKETA